jgi:hypothetical protein
LTALSRRPRAAPPSRSRRSPVATLALAARADAFVYWANFNTGAIGRADLDGHHVDQSFISGASLPLGVAVDELPVKVLRCRGKLRSGTYQEIKVPAGKTCDGTTRP